MPDYEIIRWDESNFDVSQAAFSRAAYQAQKWAFVSDYARFKIVFDNGGTYMDPGSNLIKSLDPLIEKSEFSGRDWETRTVSPGLVLSARSSNDLLGETLEYYQRLEFDSTSKFMYGHTVNLVFAHVLEQYGYRSGEDTLWSHNTFRVYPSEFFCPKLSWGGYRITSNTRATHRSAASWASEGERFRVNFINSWAPRIGDFAARKIARVATTLRFPNDLN